MRLISIGLILALLGGVPLASCAGSTDAPPAPSVSPAATDTGQELTISDALGRSIVLPGQPQRIVVAGKSTLTIVDTLYMFPEAKERIIALVVGRQPVGDFLRSVDSAFDDKVLLETDAGPEQIAPLDPDLVVLRSFMADQLGRSLEQLGLAVVYVDLETPDQYFRDLETLGRLLGNTARAVEIQSFYQSRLERIAESLRGLEEDQKPRVLLAQYSDQGGDVAFNVPSAGWIQTMEAELAGGIPVWKEAARGGGWLVVSLEQIAAWDPDQVHLISYKDDSADIVDKLRADSQWQELRAVKEGQIYGFAADIFSWDQPDPRWILGLLWLAGKVHPDRFADLDIRQEASRFFEQMYGIDRITLENQILPNLKGDLE
jgi:iron complex transport system substrate-binding protein